jgi:hypothetical protein
MGVLSFLAALRKDMTAADVHVSNAGGARRKKPKKAKPFKEMLGKPAMGKRFEIHASVLKTDARHGLVLGWAIVCKRDGADYFDLQDDHIPEDSMLAAAVDFMQAGAVAKEMHTGESRGTILFAFPLTTDVAKAFGIETKTTGLMVAMKPDSADMLSKFSDGTYTGFSIGGVRLEDEEVA